MPGSDGLKQVLTRQKLRQLAGPKSFDRGAGYFESGQVESLVEHAGKLTAMVQGSDEYRVTLSAAADDDGDLNHNCTCPVGREGDFCKHCVAVGLAWLANSAGASPRHTGVAPVVALDDARAWLLKQDKGKLAEIILNQAAQDQNLREQLLLQSAKAAGKGASVTAIRKAIQRATRTGGFVDYRSARDFSDGIDRVVDSLADLLKEGSAAEVIDLAEYALGKVEEALLNMDDSNGYISGILSRLQELHFEACHKARPDPEKLAERLFNWEMRAKFDTFYGAAGTYADLLGEKGLAVYRRCAEAVWARVPQTAPGQKDPEEFGENFRITHIMETLARQSGDVEALVAIKARNLSSAYAFLEIGEIYRAAKQPDQALAWAERGVKAFPEQTDHRLREFLADEYHRRGRHTDALQLIWKTFNERPSLESYQALNSHADRIQQWPVWRDKALEFIRAEIKRKQREAAHKPKYGWGWIANPADHSLLVQIFLWEKDVEAAWREAQAGSCHELWWLELARLREGEFPADVVPVYQKQVETLVNQKNNGSYADAVKFLRKIRDLMTGLQRMEEFASYLAAVRATHKPKRNFIKLAERL